jgi:hypothetical protein
MTPWAIPRAGVRLTHVDSRIAKYTLDNNGNVTGSTYVADPNAAYSSEDYYGVPESNSVSRRLGRCRDRWLQSRHPHPGRLSDEYPSIWVEPRR